MNDIKFYEDVKLFMENDFSKNMSRLAKKYGFFHRDFALYCKKDEFFIGVYFVIEKKDKKIFLKAICKVKNFQADFILNKTLNYARYQNWNCDENAMWDMVFDKTLLAGIPCFTLQMEICRDNVDISEICLNEEAYVKMLQRVKWWVDEEFVNIVTMENEDRRAVFHDNIYRFDTQWRKIGWSDRTLMQVLLAIELGARDLSLQLIEQGRLYDEFEREIWFETNEKGEAVRLAGIVEAKQKKSEFYASLTEYPKNKELFLLLKEAILDGKLIEWLK